MTNAHTNKNLLRQHAPTHLKTWLLTPQASGFHANRFISIHIILFSSFSFLKKYVFLLLSLPLLQLWINFYSASMSLNPHIKHKSEIVDRGPALCLHKSNDCRLPGKPGPCEKSPLSGWDPEVFRVRRKALGITPPRLLLCHRSPPCEAHCPSQANWEYPKHKKTVESPSEGKVFLRPSKNNTAGMWMCTAGHGKLEQWQRQAKINKVYVCVCRMETGMVGLQSSGQWGHESTEAVSVCSPEKKKRFVCTPVPGN